MPIAINTNRPPSTNSVPGAPRSTTTSRRGGRTRSRSPAVMGGRPPPEVMGPENPSSAAAAAAAAAKAFSNTASRSGWPEKEEYHPTNFEKQSRWPNEDPYRRYPSQQHPPPPQPHYSRGPRGPVGDEYTERRYRPHRYDHHHDRRYVGRPSQPPPPPQQQQYPPDYRYERSGGSSKGNPPPRMGGTSLVLGGSSAIHVPKKSPFEQQRGAASVFRGRPDGDSPANNKEDEDSPQKILLSLRTPTTSFEELKPKSANRGLSLSPEEPPAMQNASNPKPEALLDRSPEGHSKSGSLDMAPSFILFNQSFDSFGDGNYFNVESTLQADSFGMARSNSIEHPEPGSSLLRKSSSTGNTSHQLLTAGSGALTIGYSPVNSFGNTSSAPARRGGNMMVLDGRSPSPTQVLGMYRSYSGGGPRPEMMEDPHMRLANSSFGAPQRSFGGARDPYYNRSNAEVVGPGGERLPPFYILLRKYKMAFKDCSFLLPGLKAALLDTPIEKLEEANRATKWDTTKPMPGHPFHSSPPGRYTEPTPQDMVVARRRVESSICAFGGQINRGVGIAAAMTSGKESIFRTKDDPDAKPVASTPSSSTTVPSGSEKKSPGRVKYEETLSGRYYENDNRLSWEFEESPPVEVLDDSEGSKNTSANVDTEEGGQERDDAKDGGGSEADSSSQFCQQTDPLEADKAGSSSPQTKMRYRCKLCGQPKQNHTCPYQQSLARSIGIMIYPAVNAFTASEPGTIAAPLSEMNNFVDLKDSQSMDETSPGRPTPESVRRLGTGAGGSTTQVTPESMRSSSMHSPTSFASPSRSGSRHKRSGRHGSNPKKRTHAQANGENPDDLLFMEPMEIKPEQFRVISNRRGGQADGAYTYPPLPLPYAQRKRLSDNLFSLSNDVPKLTDECAQVLREAREKDSWDIAVAELMTQVIAIVHCPDGDHRFEGLRQYLLTLGIAS